MNRILAVALLLSVAVVSGCSTHHAVELRPYTAEESRELALEALNRSGLSFDEYHAKKAALMGEPQKSYGFDQQGEMSAERAVQLHGRPS